MHMQFGKITILAAMTFCMSLQHAFSAPINEVDVQVIDENGKTSQVLLDKMASSMRVVSDQLFLGKDDLLVANDKLGYERLLQDVGERVFTGYELTRVDLIPGPSTKIKLFAKSWSKTIVAPEIDLQFSGMEPETALYLEKRIPSVRNRLNEAISGASVEASDWAGGVLRQLVRKEIEEALPEFKAAVDLVQEKDRTIVQVIIYPVGQVVRNIECEVRSEDIPNILLFELKYRYYKKFDQLRGLPLEYVKKHEADIKQGFIDSLCQEKEIRDYNLKPQIDFVIDTDLGINVLMKSPTYKVWFEGYADLGRKEDNVSGKAHVGKYISTRDEIFAEAELITNDVKWAYTFGYTRDVGKTRWTYGRRLPKGENDFRLEYIISPKWQLRAERYSGRNRNEFGVRYRIHEFLSAEFVHGGNENYLRLIGNL